MATKVIKIESGNFSTSDKGNFSAYNEDGDRFFVFKKVMENTGFKTDADCKFPFYAKVTTKPIGRINKDGEVEVDSNGVPITVMRDQLTRIYKTKAEWIASEVDKVKDQIDLQSAIEKVIGTAELSDTSMKTLLEASW